MTQDEYRQLYQLLRKYQIQECLVGGKVYNAADAILSALFPMYYNQNQEQER